ncbi:hypothetical protein [Kitasatospora griseola]|uniref:hypothetical protein n=1 Tax=Kitasatospora griseola TaxID=2064 RepID=UPI00128BEF4C|nr:hypothetical protein [Kitasatospora griseola]
MTITVAALTAAACTTESSRSSGQSAPSGQWALQTLKPAPADEDIQTRIDAPPEKSKARILGVADIAEARLIIALRDDTCQVMTLPADGRSHTAPSSVGAPRPGSKAAISEERKAFPGKVLSGPYSQASGIAAPYFPYIYLGCSESGIAVQVEGVAPDVKVALAGDSARSWRDGTNLYIAIGRTSS